jgi:hypothetical protein
MAGSGKKRAGRVAMSVAAVGVATTVAGVAATQPASISAIPVDLAALIVVGSSTNPSGAGVEDFFQGKFNDPLYTGPNGDDIVHVNFLSGPLGIKQALEANAGKDNAVIASGWGAANLSLLMLLHDPDLSQTVVVLDNDVAAPDGGFGTRYPWFALIGVNPFPTPSESDTLAAVDTSYEYDYNSSAPADLLNPLAAVNSLVAYLNRHLNQAELDLPVNPDGTPAASCGANTCAITQSGKTLDCTDARCSSPEDRITAYVTTRGNTTYVTYTSDGLPLANLIRSVPVIGDRIADLTEPLLKLAVDSAYFDGNPIPKDPSAYRPARLFPSPGELLATALKVPGAIREGLEAATSPAPANKSAIAAHDGAVDLSTIESLAGESRKPKTNVVRDSEKAEPGTTNDAIGSGNTNTDSEPVGAEDNSDTDVATDAGDAPTANADTGAGDSAGQHDDSGNGNGEGAAAS